MLVIVIEFVVGCHFHDSPEVHDGNSIADVLYHPEIMRYKDVR